MIYKPGHLRKRSSQIIAARNWAISAFVALLGLHLSVSEVKRIYKMPVDPMNYAYLLILVLTGILIFLWIWATQKDLDLLFEWMDPERYVPPSSLKETLLILYFGLVLTGLLFSANDPFLYGVVFTLYSLVLIPSTKYMNKEILNIIESSKQRINEEMKDQTLSAKATLYREAVNVLHAYFIERPVILRLFFILVVSLIGLCAAAYWKISGLQFWGLLAYFSFFIVIFISEVIINRWRLIRDASLRKIECRLVEYLRSDENNGDAQQSAARDGKQRGGFF